MNQNSMMVVIYTISLNIPQSCRDTTNHIHSTIQPIILYGPKWYDYYSKSYIKGYPSRALLYLYCLMPKHDINYRVHV